MHHCHWRGCHQPGAQDPDPDPGSDTNPNPNPDPNPSPNPTPNPVTRYSKQNLHDEISDELEQRPAQSAPLGRAPARLPRLLTACLAALAGSTLPGERPAHWAPSHRLVLERAASKPMSPPLTIQEQQRLEDSLLHDPYHDQPHTP